MDNFLDTAQVTQTFSLTWKQVSVISEAQLRLGSKNRSEAVRQIIDQWAVEHLTDIVVTASPEAN